MTDRAKFHLWPDGAIVAFLAIVYGLLIVGIATQVGGFWMWFMIFLASATAFLFVRYYLLRKRK